MKKDIKEEVKNHLQILDKEDPFQDRSYDMELQTDEHNSSEEIQSALNELEKEAVIDHCDPQEITDGKTFWLVKRKKLNYFILDNDASKKYRKIAVASTTTNLKPMINYIIHEAVRKFGLSTKEISDSITNFPTKINKKNFDHYDIKIKI
jgi:hypothetical protein